MTLFPDRRAVLQGVAAALAAGAAGAEPDAGGLRFGPPRPFSFASLQARARELAAGPFVQAKPPAADIVEQIDYDAWGAIHFKTDDALFRDRRFPATFFHLGRLSPRPVAIHRLQGGLAQEVVYDPAAFDMPADSPARRLPKGAGFAGFRLQEARDGRLDWRRNDWAAFLGASYFRAIGELYQYGLSARAVALDTSVADRPEEFPAFTQIYIEEPGAEGADVTVYALLEGPSITGACRFGLTRGKGVLMDIEQVLFLRRTVERFGVAPLTSMYWFSETAKPTAIDWRPEVHDSDGLAMWTGQGERLWRPLNDPPRPMASAFADERPKGFGLLQRDRVFDHYLDGVNYDRRPSLWVEPKGDWGKGSVQLIELPTRDETEDNIVAAWVPAKAAVAGARFHFAYRLHWLADEPFPSPLARCVATRLGRGGQVGQAPIDGGVKFVVEFQGGPLTSLPDGVTPTMVVLASRGRVGDNRRIEPVSDGAAGHWRAEFDLSQVDGLNPVELHMHLTVDGERASETWVFQHLVA